MSRMKVARGDAEGLAFGVVTGRWYFGWCRT